MIKVLIVEDSKVKSQYLEYILSSDPEIEVIGNVSNGKLAIDFIEDVKPDIITMDIDMPVMNGIEATQIIMAESPIPIIIVTAKKESYNINTSIDALSFGAISLIDQPYGIGHPNEINAKRKLISLVKLMSKVKVVTRKRGVINKNSRPNSVDKKDVFEENTTPGIKEFLDKKLVAIGVSSGGPQVLSKIFSGITNNFPFPILVVQHITEGFIENMVNWLKDISSIPISVAKHSDVLRPGHIYFAPDNYQMGVSLNRIRLFKSEKVNRICPSVDFLFNNLSINYGGNVIGIILTGMGSDGAEGAKALKDKGSITIAQDKESSLVFGMPSEAIKNGSIDYVQNTDQIANILVEIEKNS